MSLLDTALDALLVLQTENHALADKCLGAIRACQLLIERAPDGTARHYLEAELDELLVDLAHLA